MESVRERISSRQSRQPYPLVWEPNWGRRSPGQWSTEGAVGTALHGGPHSFCCLMILLTVLVVQRHAAATSDLPAHFASPHQFRKQLACEHERIQHTELRPFGRSLTPNLNAQRTAGARDLEPSGVFLAVHCKPMIRFASGSELWRQPSRRRSRLGVI